MNARGQNFFEEIIRKILNPNGDDISFFWNRFEIGIAMEAFKIQLSSSHMCTVGSNNNSHVNVSTGALLTKQ